MLSLRSIGRTGLAAGLFALAGGIVAAGVAALAAGDWWLARQPWIGVGLTLLVVGLAMTAVFALLLDAVEPVGRLRLLAVPPALVVGSFWAFCSSSVCLRPVLPVVPSATSARCCTRFLKRSSSCWWPPYSSGCRS
jgi:hypothetical protein